MLSYDIGHFEIHLPDPLPLLREEGKGLREAFAIFESPLLLWGV